MGRLLALTTIMIEISTELWIEHPSDPSLLIKSLEKFSLTDLGCVLLSVAMAWFLLNPYVSAMIFIGIIFYVLIYTIWLKRNNPLNIVIGGFAGSALPWRDGLLQQVNRRDWFSGWVVSFYVDASALLVVSY